MAQAFDPDKFLAETAPKAQSFDPDKFLAETGGTPSLPQQSLGQKALHLVGEAGKAVDSVTGAPVRKFIGDLQDGKGVGSAVLDGISQFAHNPDKAPTGHDIAKKLGIDDSTGQYQTNDRTGITSKREHSDADIMGTIIDMTADPLVIGEGVSGALKGATELANATSAGRKAVSTLGALGNTAAEAAKSIPGKAATKALSIGFGPSSEAINKYLARSADIKNASSVEEIKQIVDDSVQDLFKNFDQAKISRDDAKDALKGIQSQVRDASQDATFQHRIKQADIKDQLKSAEDALNSSYAKKVDELKSVRSPVNLSDDVTTAVDDLKKKVSDLSGQSYKILDDNPDKTVNLQAPFRSLDDVKKQLVIAGKGPVTDEAKNVYNSIENLQKSVGVLPVQMPLPEAKKLIQQLDSTIKYGKRAGVFSDEMNQALLGLRKGVDQQLKTLPEYASKMQEVADHAKLLSQASDRFGDSRAAASRLNSIHSPMAKDDRELLQQLGEKTGRDFTAPINDYVQAQATLKDPKALDQIKRSLPEYKEMRKQGFAKASVSRPEALPTFVENQVAPLRQSEEAAQQALADKTNALGAAEDSLSPYKSLTPRNTQNAIKGLMKSPGKENIEIRKTLENLSKASGKDFLQMIEDRRIADQFKGEFRIGSRNVGFWGGLGYFAGHPALGITLGATVDRFGPEIAQKILDGVIKIKGAPTIEKIKDLRLPSSAEKFLIDELPKSGIEKASAEKVSSNDNQTQDRFASAGLDKVMQEKPEMQSFKDSLASNPKAQELLRVVSSLKPGTKMFDNTVSKLQALIEKGS